MALTASEMNDYPQIVPLKPCPFCGGEAYYRTPVKERGTAFDIMVIECIKCGASPYAINVYSGADDKEKQEAIAKQWNRRNAI